MTVASIDGMSPAELAGQAVLVRIDAQDEVRMRESLPTLALVSEAGARVIVATHYGLPPDAPRVDALAARLIELLGRPVGKLDDWKGEAGLAAVSHLAEGKIMMIENLAFESGEDVGDDKLADALARLAGIYCNEAFALSHEVRASTVGVAKKAMRAVGGLAFERELSMLDVMLGELRIPSLALLGGEVSRDKLLLAEEIVRRADRTLVAGQLVLPFLVARELLPSSAAVNEEMVTIAERIIREARDNDRCVNTPADFTVVDKVTFERLSRGEPVPPAPSLLNVGERQIKPDQIICDLGKATRWSWSDWFGASKTIFWHGPVGICEIGLFCEGTRFLATELANRTWPTVHRRVICGASLVAALHRIGFPTEQIRHLTYAGRAALHYFAGRPLPAVDVLSQVGEQKRSKPSRILIPLSGSDRDLSSLHAVADVVARDAELILLHVRQGPDEEQYPDLAVGLSGTERLERRIESERIFARANAILAARGLLSTHQLAVQGTPTQMILRYGQRTGAELIVLVAGGSLATLGARRVIERATCATLVVRPAITKVAA
jgi:phosphoglycerate kinase